MSDNGNKRPFNDTAGLVLFFKIVIIAVFVYPLIHYSLVNKEQDVNNTTIEEQQENVTEPPIEDIPQIEAKEVVVIKQPACPLSYLHVVLQDLCKDLVAQSQQCTPEDFHNMEKHKMPKNHAKSNTTGEPRGTIVGCIAAGLLLTSLGAACVELYKAKSQTPAKMKPPMSRKCSLADLTVLKHSRKELIRRESIMEIPEHGASAKQLGFRPPPLYRRCSFPTGPTESTYGVSRQDSRRTSIESRRLSVMDSRRNSISSRKASIISIDNESPERRHWSRLVHRH